MRLFEKEKMMRMPFLRIIIYSMVILIGAGVFIRLLADMPQTKPDLHVKVTVFEPAKTTEPMTNITVKFSRDMVPDDSLDKPLLDPPLEFTPPIPGIARWIEKNIIRFYPDNELLPATEYTARVQSDKIYLYGNRINDDRKFEFRTPDLAIIDYDYSFQTFDEKSDSGRIIFNLTFNYPVEIEELKKRILINGIEDTDNRSLEFDISEPTVRPRSSVAERWNEDLTSNRYQRIIITSDKIERSSSAQKYQLKIQSNLSCSGCSIPMPTDYIEIARIDPKQRFVIHRMYPHGQGIGYSIQIDFSAVPDIERAKKYISTDPPLNLELEQRGHSVMLRGDFKSGKSYEIKVDKGMPSLKGPFLETEFSSIVTVPDLPSTAKFTSEGIFLPTHGTGLLEIESINIDSISVEVEEVFANNIVYFLAEGRNSYRGRERDISALGRSFFIKDMKLDGAKNEPYLTTVDLAGIIGERTRGIFKISVRNKNNRWQSDSRYIMLTDIGISARMASDYLMVWVNSLKETNPVSGAEVRLISRNNQILISGMTDSRGIAIFDNIRDKVEGFDPFLVLVSYKDDMTYLKFDLCRLPISDFDVSGRPYLNEGYESFVCTERGIYRPGDTIHISSITRGVASAMPEQFPILVCLYEPQGRLFKQFRLQTGGSSFSVIDCVIPDFARTGKYIISVKIGDIYEIGRTDFLVEEFMPDRIKVLVETEKNSYKIGETVNINVRGKFLFGPPTAGYNLSGHITIEEETFSPGGYSDYSFIDVSKAFTTREINLPDVKLDSNGRYNYKYDIPEKLAVPSILKAMISGTVSEEGGRTVSGYGGIKIFPYEKYVGIKLNLDGYAKIGKPVEFDLVALDINGQTVAADSVEVRMHRLIYHSILRQDKDGYYRYASEETVQPCDSAYKRIFNGQTRLQFTPADYGRYRITATDKKSGHSSSVTFFASGWGYAPWAMTNPDRIEIGLDKDVYQPGENALVQVRAPFGGKLLLTLEKDRILDFITVEMKENTAEIKLPIKIDYFPNVYISATVIRPSDQIQKSAPGRAFGMAPLVLSNKEKDISIDLKMPSEIKPSSKLTVDVDLGNDAFAEITLALIDEGILQLTDYQTPDPLNFFFGKRRPYLDLYDNYSLILPNVGKQASHLSPAGDRMFSETRKRHLSPTIAQRVKPVALWSGLIKADQNGKASLEFDIPQFNGSLQAMAIACNKDRFGSAQKNIIVRDKIVVIESFPRFMAPGDEIEGLVTLFNNTGYDAEIEAELKLEGPAKILSSSIQTVKIKNNSEANAVFKFKADLIPGKVKCTITARTTLEKSSVSFELANRPAQPLYTEFGSGVITDNEAAVITMPKHWIEGTDRYIIKISSMAAVSFASDIEYLLQYPYGCIEQTTSKIFPLLYYGDLVRFLKPDIIGTKGAEYFIQEGILRLTGFMNDNGFFSFWYGGDEINYWGSVYAAHCLIEAKNAGYYLDEKINDKIVEGLSDIAAGAKYQQVNAAARIYAAFVLSKTGKLKNKILNDLKKINPAQIETYSKYQLAGALAAAGDFDHAAELLPTEIFPETFEPETGGNFSSGVRTNAILLDVLLEFNPKSGSIPVLAQALMKDSRGCRWYTTQEKAYALMALGKYFKNVPRADFKGEIRINGKVSYSIDTAGVEIVRRDLSGKTVTMAIEGKGNCYYYWQASGVGTSHAPEEFSRGIRVERKYFDDQGRLINPDSIMLGEQLICRITAEAVNNNLSYVVINDLLPGGFEIENPRLKTTPRLSWIPANGNSINYQDIRDDRLLLFVDLTKKHPVNFYYSLRAICAGEFTVPPIAAECMYNPPTAGAASSGRIKIRGRDKSD